MADYITRRQYTVAEFTKLNDSINFMCRSDINSSNFESKAMTAGSVITTALSFYTGLPIVAFAINTLFNVYFSGSTYAQQCYNIMLKGYPYIAQTYSDCTRNGRYDMVEVELGIVEAVSNGKTVEIFQHCTTKRLKLKNGGWIDTGM